MGGNNSSFEDANQKIGNELNTIILTYFCKGI
jgi:hypothetical protein